jgi:hypothetical protein
MTVLLPSAAKFAACSALVGASLAAAGCNLGAPAAYALFGPGQIEAEHELAPVRTVVFVDDRQNVLPRVAMRAALGNQIAETLLAQGLVPNVVSTRDAIALTRQREDGTKPLSIAAIGRELECQQVVYVLVRDFNLAGDGGGTTAGSTGFGAAPTAIVEVKVIDVVSNERTFPLSGTGGAGQEIVAKLREVDQDELRTPSKRKAVEDALIVKTADRVSKLFYKHERLDLGENLGPRGK